MKQIALILFFVCIFSIPVFPADYIHDEPGKNILYDGTMISGTQTIPFTQSVLVKPEQRYQDHVFDIVHYNVLRGKTFFEERTLYYSVKPDGVYLEATQDGSKPIEVLTAPSLELPIPAIVGQKFQRIRNENQGISTIEFEVISINEPYALGENAPETIHIRGIGTFASHADKTSIPLKKEIWYAKEGKLKQITVKDLPDKTQLTSEIHYLKTIETNQAVESDASDQPQEGGQMGTTDLLQKGK